MASAYSTKKSDILDDQIDSSPLLVQRLENWRHAVSLVHAYANSAFSTQSAASHGLLKQRKIVSEPPNFSGSSVHGGTEVGGTSKAGAQGGTTAISSAFTLLARRTDELLQTSEATAQGIKESVIPQLELLDSDLDKHYKTLRSQGHKSLKEIEKHREITAKHLESLGRSVSVAGVTGQKPEPKQDPYLLHRKVRSVAAEQIEKENQFAESNLNVQNNFGSLEQHIIDVIQNALAQLDSLSQRYYQAGSTASQGITQDFASIKPAEEWEHFLRANAAGLVPSTGYKRDPSRVAFTHADHDTAKPIIEGTLSRRGTVLKGQKPGFYVLTPAGFLHEYKSADYIQDNHPELSLYIPESEIGGLPSQGSGDLSFKLVSKDANKVIATRHKYTFTAASYEELVAWHNAITQVAGGSSDYLEADEGDSVSDEAGHAAVAGAAGTNTSRAPAYQQPTTPALGAESPSQFSTPPGGLQSQATSLPTANQPQYGSQASGLDPGLSGVGAGAAAGLGAGAHGTGLGSGDQAHHAYSSLANDEPTLGGLNQQGPPGQISSLQRDTSGADRGLGSSNFASTAGGSTGFEAAAGGIGGAAGVSSESSRLGEFTSGSQKLGNAESELSQYGGDTQRGVQSQFTEDFGSPQRKVENAQRDFSGSGLGAGIGSGAAATGTVASGFGGTAGSYGLSNESPRSQVGEFDSSHHGTRYDSRSNADLNRNLSQSTSEFNPPERQVSGLNVNDATGNYSSPRGVGSPKGVAGSGTGSPGTPKSRVPTYHISPSKQATLQSDRVDGLGAGGSFGGIPVGHNAESSAYKSHERDEELGLIGDKGQYDYKHAELHHGGHRHQAEEGLPLAHEQQQVTPPSSATTKSPRQEAGFGTTQPRDAPYSEPSERDVPSIAAGTRNPLLGSETSYGNPGERTGPGYGSVEPRNVEYSTPSAAAVPGIATSSRNPLLGSETSYGDTSAGNATGSAYGNVQPRDVEYSVPSSEAVPEIAAGRRNPLLGSETSYGGTGANQGTTTSGIGQVKPRDVEYSTPSDAQVPEIAAGNRNPLLGSETSYGGTSVAPGSTSQSRGPSGTFASTGARDISYSNPEGVSSIAAGNRNPLLGSETSYGAAPNTASHYETKDPAFESKATSQFVQPSATRGGVGAGGAAAGAAGGAGISDLGSKHRSHGQSPSFDGVAHDTRARLDPLSSQYEAEQSAGSGGSAPGYGSSNLGQDSFQDAREDAAFGGDKGSYATSGSKGQTGYRSTSSGSAREHASGTYGDNAAYRSSEQTGQTGYGNTSSGYGTAGGAAGGIAGGAGASAGEFGRTSDGGKSYNQFSHEQHGSQYQRGAGGYSGNDYSHIGPDSGAGQAYTQGPTGQSGSATASGNNGGGSSKIGAIGGGIGALAGLAGAAGVQGAGEVGNLASSAGQLGSGNYSGAIKSKIPGYNDVQQAKQLGSGDVGGIAKSKVPGSNEASQLENAGKEFKGGNFEKDATNAAEKQAEKQETKSGFSKFASKFKSSS